MRHRLAGARRALDRREAGRPARPRRRAAGRRRRCASCRSTATYTESLTLDQARRADVHRRVRPRGQAAQQRSRRTGRGSTSRRCTATSRASGSSGIEVVDHVIPGYWEDEGYDVDGWVGRSNGRDDQPHDVDVSARDRTRFPRFDRVERVVHWCNATLFLVLLFTGASLYVGPLSTLVGAPRTR